MKELLDAAFTADDRAVSPVLGVALLFAIAAIGLSVWQTAVIPQQNAEVEFNHYSEIRDDIDEVRQAHQDTVTSGEPQSPTLQLGATYQARIFGVNPPNPQGSLESQRLGSFRLENAPVATSDTNVTTEDVCGQPQPHTDELRYDPGYNRLSSSETPPVVYENTVVYRETESGDLLLDSDQVLIQGSTINILPVQSQAQLSAQSTTLTLKSQGYAVEKTLEEDASPDLVVPTDIPADRWENDLLDSQISAGFVNGVSDVSGENAVRIDLSTTPGQFPWTVRCAITTDGETTTFRENVAEPPRIINGGVGHGGITEHTVDSNEDELVLENGKWIEVDSIAEIRLGPSEETVVPNAGGFNGGEGIGVEFRIEGESGNTVYVLAEVTGEPGNWQAKKVKLGKDPGNYQGKSLTPEAARAILETGEPDILDVDSYKASSFQTQDGNFGSFIEEIQAMENATIHITDLHGRVDMQVISGELSLEIADADKKQTYVYNNTSAIDFNVTATGVTDDSENVDLKVRDSQGQQLDSTKPRVDRETISLDGGSTEFTLTWEPDWGSLSSGTTYEILVDGESDQAFGKVRIVQQDNGYVTVELVEYNETVEYGDDLTATVRAKNLGDKTVNDTVTLPLGGSCCPNSAKEKVTLLDPGESETVTLTYDTGVLDTDAIGETTLKAKSNNFNSKDSAKVNITGPDLILEPTVEDLRAGRERLNHSMGFTLGEDTGGATIKIDLSDTGDAVKYDGSSANWTLVKGNGSISLNTNNNRVTSVKYQTNSTHDRAGDPIRIRADYTDTTDADTDAVTKYDVEYELTSANNYPQGETNSTSFNTTLGEDIRVDIVDAGSPVEYGDNLTTTVRVKNVGSASGGSSVQLSLDGTPGANETVQELAPGESKDITMTYDTDQLDPSVIGEAELEAETRDDTATETVTIESAVIEEPFVEDLQAGQEGLTHGMGFRLGDDIGQATIKIDLTDTGGNVSHDGNSANWTVVQGNGSISLNTNNNRVTSVKYQTNSTHDREGDRIVIEADYTDTTDATAGVSYDVTYKLTSANNYPQGETNSTSFETTE